MVAVHQPLLGVAHGWVLLHRLQFAVAVEGEDLMVVGPLRPDDDHQLAFIAALFRLITVEDGGRIQTGPLEDAPRMTGGVVFPDIGTEGIELFTFRIAW